MPYLRVTCPEMPPEQRRIAAQRLTEAVNEIFWNPRSGLTRDELRERTTVHFVPYADDVLFIGARTPRLRGVADITVELSDWSMPKRMQRRIARELTPVLAQLFAIAPDAVENINIRFHSYPPSDFAVGGRLLSDIVPRAARFFKRLLSR